MEDEKIRKRKRNKSYITDRRVVLPLSVPTSVLDKVDYYSEKEGIPRSQWASKAFDFYAAHLAEEKENAKDS